jgi:hypothetical protein
MKAYLETIEKILGTELEAGKAGTIDFDDESLRLLKLFSEAYQERKMVFKDDQPKISCYMPFPEILSGDFRTYSGKGDLQGHWPSFDELANLAVLCDRVILFDHLGHYASSAISGYVKGYRYDGMRNWLKALAEWRELIMEDVICIVPPDLMISGPLQNLWDEGELQDFAGNVYYLLNPDAGDFKDITEADDLLQEMSGVEDYLTTASIPVARNNSNAPYFNNNDDLKLHEAIINAILTLIRKEHVMADKSRKIDLEMIRQGSSARLCLSTFLNQDRYTAGDVFRLRREDPDLAYARGAIRQSIRDFSQDASFLKYPDTRFQPHLDRLEEEIGQRLSKFGKWPEGRGRASKKITLGFAGLILDGSSGKEFSMAANGMKSTLNNLPVQAQLPGSICHYFISTT